MALVDAMLDLAKVTPQDVVIDLGSGDGRTVITAAKRGARALGIEYNPDLVELSGQAAARAGVADRATFMKADLFDADLSQATVITMFLLPEINLKLRPKILDLRPGTRIVSNTFTMSLADFGRLAGSFSRHPITICRMDSGNVGRSRSSGSGRSLTCAINMSRRFRPKNGDEPVSIS